MTLQVPELSEQTNQWKETLTDRVLKYAVAGLTGVVVGACVGEGIAVGKYLIHDQDILNFIELSPDLMSYGLAGAVVGLPVGLVKYYMDRKKGID
tara:strand:+ start:1920 stop:2204 length:285 start_codon:yes stop_codon:yes gene_type:complete